MLDLSQIIETISVGLVVLDQDLKVLYWNHWMAEHSRLTSSEVLGTSIFTHFPSLNSPKFLRNFRAVRTFGNFAFFSQKLHKYLFPFRPLGSLSAHMKYMQQSCSMGPLRDETGAITAVFLVVQDVTELALYEQRLMELNHKDALTGVFNRRHLDQRLREEVDRSQRYGTPLSVIMLDVDFFKKINDNHGHQAGDGVLAALGARLGGMVRSTDCFARYGGEEFCCLLTQTPLDNAMVLAERFRSTIENEPMVHRDLRLSVTISLGVAEFAAGDTTKSLMQRVDEALYAAKSSGRNRVVKASPRVTLGEEGGAPMTS